jgi:imidazolonepropionase-like amidohydrolase
VTFVRRACIVALTLGALSPCVDAHQTTTRQPSTLALTRATVIDAAGAAPLQDVTVVVVDGRIRSIEPARIARVPEGAEVHDLSGKFLIPGLWNMHVHAVGYDQAAKAMRSVLASGITGVRDMGAPVDDVLRLRGETSRGTLLGPHMVVAGPLLEGALPPAFANNPMLKAVKDAAEARQAVADLERRGVDFIKVSDAVPRDVYFAVAAETRRRGLAFAGHVPPAVSAREASDAGQRSIEHLGGQHHAVLRACSSREQEASALVVKQLDEAIAAVFAGKEPDDQPLFQTSMTKPIVDGYSAARASALMQRFVENHTWHSPTLLTLERLWDRKDLSPADVQYGERLKRLNVQVVGAMHRAGVRLLAGTDGPLGEAGKLHDELVLLVRAGLSPLQALHTATRNAAEFVGRAADLGTIERGKIADLVVLDGDPIADIRNTRRVHAVVLNGRFLTAAALTSGQ